MAGKREAVKIDSGKKNARHSSMLFGVKAQ